jgi:hypothetical protein
MDSAPTVSIGLPVRNGARYLSEAVSSLLGQSFRDLELIVSDNASIDETQGICEEFAQSDARVRYYRQGENIGGPANWNFVFEKSRGAYFKWASSNDVCDSTYVEKCEAVLREDPEVVLCYSRTAFLDADGQIESLYDGDFQLLQSTPVERFKRVLLSGSLNNAMLGLIRTSALRKTGLERNYENGDLPLMAELALIGKWKCLPTPLFFRRIAPNTHMADVTPEERRALFYSGAPPIRLPFLRPYLGYAGAALGVPLPIFQRVKVLGFLLRFGYWKWHLAADDLKGLMRSGTSPVE